MAVLAKIDTANILGMELSIYGDVNNPLFLAKEIAERIEYDKSSLNKMINSVDESEKVRNIIPTLGGLQETWFLTEDGVYEVLMTSRKPIAKEFRKGFKNFLKAWRLGKVKVVETIMDSYMIEDPVARALAWAEEKKASLLLESKVEILTHTDNTYTATELANEIGMKSAQKFNVWLQDCGFQRRVNGTWVPYAKFSEEGYVEIKQEIVKTKEVYHRKFTQKGREYILGLAKDCSGKGRVC